MKAPNEITSTERGFKPKTTKLPRHWHSPAAAKRALLIVMSVLVLLSLSTAVSGKQAQAAAVTIDAAKLKLSSRLYFPIRDEKNQLYMVYLFANDESRHVTAEDEIWAGASEGDVFYTGTYQAALVKSGEKVGKVQNINLNFRSFNATRSLSFKLPGDGKSRPDLMFLSQTESSNINTIRGFVITGGRLHSLDFAGKDGKVWGKEGVITGDAMRGLSGNRIQTRVYDNSAIHYRFDMYKLDLKNLKLLHIDDLYQREMEWPKGQGTRAFMESLKQSALKHVLPGNPKVKIGMTEKQVRAIMGKPSQVTNGEWSGYLVYGDNWIGFNDYVQGSRLPVGVKVWELSQDLNVYLDPGQVREWLGKPTEEYLDEEQEAYMIVYRWKDAMLTFVYEDEYSPISMFTIY